MPSYDEPDDINPEQVSNEGIDENAAENHEGEPEHVCDHCPFKSSNIQVLKRHNAIAHARNVLYVCNICNFQCKWNRTFYEHARTHFLVSHLWF